MYVSTHKKELLVKINTEAGSVIGGDVSVGDFSVSLFKNFPNLAIQLKQIDVKDSLFSQHGHRLFYAQNVYLRLNTLKLLVGKVSVNKLQIDDGAFHLFTDTTGYTNTYLLKSKKTKATNENKSGTNQFDKLEISRFAITIENNQTEKLYDFYINKLEAKSKNTDTTIDLELKKSILVKSLAFNQSIGTYLENHLLEGKFNVQYHIKNEALTFSNIPLDISKQPFILSGLFAFGQKQQFTLAVKTENVLLDFAKTLLTKKNQKSINLASLKTPIDVSATIDGSLTGGNPIIKAIWKTENNSLRTPLLSFDKCSFNGVYTNQVIPGQPTTDENSMVELTNFKGNWEGLETTARTIQINNLTYPVVTADMRSDFSLQQLNALIQGESLSLTKGAGSLQFIYKGPIENITTKNASLDGNLNITNGSILMTSSQSQLENCKAKIRFQNSDLIIDTLNCTIQKNPILFQGKAENILTMLGESKSPVYLSLNVSAPVINVGNISSMLYRKLPSKKISTGQKKGNLSKSIQKLDNLLSNGNIGLTLTTDKLIYRRFQARKATVNIAIDHNSWRLQKAALLHGNGSLSVTGKVTEERNGRFVLNAGMKMKNLDAQQIWYQFENFGIPSPTDKNIRGLLSADATINLLINKAGGFDIGSLHGEADFSIKNGSLLNFKPLEDIQEVVFKKRDFSSIEFAEIKDKLSFSNGQLTINRMEINSSVLSLYVEGMYGLRGKTDISIQVPLSNLKKRNPNYKPENLGADRKGGISVFLRATSGDDGVIKLKYDPFGRFRKSAQKNK